MVKPRFHNTLTRKLDPLVPIVEGEVSMYSCGPTVYDFAHIGNFRTFLFADVLRRFLEAVGLRVHHVMNLTDVGHMTEDASVDGGGQDKMAAAGERLLAAKKAGQAHAAEVEDPHDPHQVAAFYIAAFKEDAAKLGLRVVADGDQNLPRATENVEAMLELIGRLLGRGHAYVAEDGAAYFRVSSFPAYGALSGNALEDLRGGAGGRVTAGHQAAKEHPADFLLWKPDATHLMKWNPAQLGLTGPAAELGVGYPGWHIECSAMAREALGRDRIDIHTGGEDNIFPHHECEIAQSRCGNGRNGTESFANLWLHSRHLMVDGAKMSKSKGNFLTVRGVLEGGFTGRPVDPAALRLELIRSSYRGQTDFTAKGLRDSASAVAKLRHFAATLPMADAAPAEDVREHPAAHRFLDALADDLNTAGALAAAFAFAAGEPPADAQSAGVLALMDGVLGVLEAAAPARDLAWASGLARSIDAARAAKDYAAADAARAELLGAGFTVKTTAEGTEAEAPLA
ncbi:cysteine--tRNA ligase [Phycisphaera mikurensis]|uniref:Cysteine--tRNA ligase n=1 Tax=Phycisphaera mikurensis (strain NBRC 102666 / KCTC 22515 / FYK2301M01) TaxID=1142394 RepID=I0IEU6_PHYMF|nr:cysteine--tRNA ligase [Phycisphaera mikurensis]MBB6441579.1 cysteinyl-tRNA synthetase [Phycisphaera mikurensis]BAM03784.1 cysteinyl-tRNA synthetase [Phycisphaera mikurensis NBRC 102666]